MDQNSENDFDFWNAGPSGILVFSGFWFQKLMVISHFKTKYQALKDFTLKKSS